MLPTRSFEGNKLQNINAEVDYQTMRLEMSDPLPLENLKTTLRLNDEMLKLQPLNFGFAGGIIASQIALDAREPTISSDVQVNFNRIRID